MMLRIAWLGILFCADIIRIACQLTWYCIYWLWRRWQDEHNAVETQRINEQRKQNADGMGDVTAHHTFPGGKPFNHEESPSFDDQAMEWQKNRMRELGIKIPKKCTETQAHNLIENFLKTPESITNRQKMVLRFWRRCDLMCTGRRIVSKWIDQWYAEDDDHIKAWEKWKKETGDDGTQRNPMVVPLGIGNQYLIKVKLARPTSIALVILIILIIGLAL